MAYSELIKNFDSVRAYLRAFYVYGFRYRNEYDQKSARSYDNERRRVESWLGEYMTFGQDAEGRRVFLSVDSRAIPENPLYRAFRTKSFTDRDIMLHFHLTDILSASGGLAIGEVMDELTDRLYEFESDEMPDESTVRKKLKEYVSLGLVKAEKRGRETVYALPEDRVRLDTWDAAAAFFSEAAPLGVVGSFIRDRLPRRFERFRFKHHYILYALDSEQVYTLLTAIREQREVTFTAREKRMTLLPLRLYIGTQTGRQYLFGYSFKRDRFSFHRVDLMDGVAAGEIAEVSPELRRREAEFRAHAWGVTGQNDGQLTHIEMTVEIGPGEGYILRRLEREKRCGTLEQTDGTHWRFSADVLDAVEMLPWLRTFIGRVTDLKCSDSRVTERFRKDFEAMEEMYGEARDDIS